MIRERVFTAADVSGRSAVEDSADVVIIGSGCAGATAARVLSECGLDVIVVEEGPWVKPAERQHDTWGSFRRSWRDCGFQVAEGRSLLPVIQGRCVGGSTAVNGAIVHRMPEKVLHHWKSEFGIDGMITMDALERIYARLDDELGVGAGPDAVLGRNNELMRKGCDAVGITSNVIRRNVRDCEGSAHCLQGCPNARKQSMDVTYLPRAVAAGARLYADARADRLVVERGRAAAVTGMFVDDENGRVRTGFTMRARRAVIVAASAIQTPLLLQASGVGRISGMVGQRLQMHPGASMIGVYDEPVGIWSGISQGYETTHWWDERMKMESVGVPFEVGAARLPGYGRELMRRIAGFGHISQWGVQIRSTALGSVRRGWSGRTVIKWSWSPEDIARLKIGLRRLAEIAFAAGAKAVYPGIHGMPEEVTGLDAFAKLDVLPDDPRLFHGIASHMFGTAIMGRDPRTSVVGLDARVHDVNGLFVADSSIYPTNMGVNPAHTICAVSWLIAERIAGA
ncbi:MAG: GMC family oxidoreductase [Deltaproteobacteria bacterium]|nr:GMC family oxidoreductase [Deltaproteobacteria bacterium]